MDTARNTMSCAARLEVLAVPGLPLIERGDDLPKLVGDAIAGGGYAAPTPPNGGEAPPCPPSIAGAGIGLVDGDVVVVTSKVVSRAEGRFVDLAKVVVSSRAEEVARTVGADPRMVELILSESSAVSRTAKNVLVVRHRLGFVVANAGIDFSNAVPRGAPPGTGPWALLLPEDPDGSAERIREALSARFGAAIHGGGYAAPTPPNGGAAPPRPPSIGVVVSDSFGRPFRLGTVGAAIGVAGLPPIWDRCGEEDLYGRKLDHTFTALADQVAAAADLVAGQAAERRAIVVVRGLSFPVGDHEASELLRSPKEDLYA